MPSVEKMDNLEDQELRELLAKGGKLLPCPSCGARVWSLLPRSKFGTVFLSVEPPDPGANSISKIETDLILCKNCGYIRLHLREFLSAFLGE